MPNINNKITLNGKRIYLQKLTVNDVGREYLSWLNDSEITQFLEVRFNPPKNLAQLKNYVKEKNQSINSVLFGIYHNDRNMIGTIKLEPIDKNHKFAYIGIIIGDKNYHGLNFGQESIEIICNYSKKYLNLDYLYAGCYSSNIASYKCFIKSDFVISSVIKKYWMLKGKREDQIILKKEL